MQHQQAKAEREGEVQQRKDSQKFIQEHMSVVETLASNIYGRGNLPPGVDFQDLIGWGIEGLLKAKDGFNAEKGAQFNTYANYRVRGEILDHLRKEWKHRSPSVYSKYREKIQDRISQVLDESLDLESPRLAPSGVRVNDLLSKSAVVYMLSLDDISVTSMAEKVEDHSQTFEDDLEKEEDKSLLWNHVEGLDDQEKEIVTLFYKENRTQREISETLKLSRTKVCRLHSQILEKLKRKMVLDFET